MPPSKRTEGRNGKVPAAKKPKLDPITEKVEQVLNALKMEECKVPEPRTCIDSFLAAVPFALGHGSASNERHEYQTSVANMVGEILNATETSWQQSLGQAKDNHEAAKQEEAARDAALEEAQSRLTAQRAEVEERKGEVHASITAELEAEKQLERAHWEVNNFDALQLEKSSQRDEVSSFLENDFEKLKAAEFSSSKDQRENLAKLVKILKDLSLDSSLCKAIPDALKKKPADRGTFDNMVVSQVDDSLKAKLEALGGELGDSEALKAAKQSALHHAEEAVTAAQATKAASEESLKLAEEKCSELEAEESKAKESSEEQKEVASNMDIEHFVLKTHLDNWHEAMKAFEFLRDRVLESPEPEIADESMAEQHEPEAVTA